MRKALLAVALAMASGSVGAQEVEFCQGEQRHVFLVDRTSLLNEREKIALEDGVEVIFSRPDLAGEVHVAEVRGSALSYEWILDLCVEGFHAPSPACRIAHPAEENGSLLSNPVGALARLFGTDDQGRPSNADRLRCERERSQSLSRRQESQAAALEHLKERSGLAVDPSPTALAATVFRVIRSRCSHEPCHLYIFSNLLDAGWSELVGMEDGHRERGAARVRDDPFFDPAAVLVETVAVWGFGFNEQNGEQKEELPQDVAVRLVAYWEAFFQEIGAEVEAIDFELPQ